MTNMPTTPRREGSFLSPRGGHHAMPADRKSLSALCGRFYACAMSARSGTVSIEWEGRLLYGRFLVFGRTLIVEAGDKRKPAQLGQLAPPLLARMILREMAQDEEI